MRLLQIPNHQPLLNTSKQTHSLLTTRKNTTTKKSLEIQAYSCDYFESCNTWFKIPDHDLPEDLKWYLLGWCFCHRASEPTLVPVFGHGGPWIKDINKAISFHHCFLCSGHFTNLLIFKWTKFSSFVLVCSTKYNSVNLLLFSICKY